jgi:hypothetical protein
MIWEIIAFFGAAFLVVTMALRQYQIIREEQRLSPESDCHGNGIKVMRLLRRMGQARMRLWTGLLDHRTTNSQRRQRHLQLARRAVALLPYFRHRNSDESADIHSTHR